MGTRPHGRRVGDLCRIINLTKTHFARTFKQTFRLPPHVYIMRRRIDRASKLMIETDTPLTEIALNCGFNDQAHLSRQFRRHTAVPAAAWRRYQKARLYCQSQSDFPPIGGHPSNINM
jgi:AraC-like DNA-binding protein